MKYKFFKILPSGKKKYADSFNSTLDSGYHAYINWCRENKMAWELVRVYDNKVMFSGDVAGEVTQHY